MTRFEFNELVEQLNRRLFGYAFRILRNQEEAEDAVQETFVKLWNMEEKLIEYKSIEALATTMIKNYSIDQLRKSKLHKYEEFNTHDQIYSPALSPHDKMEQQESANIIHTIIDNMPDIYKTVIKLRDIEGFSYEEIAEKTEQNINTIRVTLSRARGLIRNEYNKFQNEDRRTKQVTRKVL